MPSKKKMKNKKQRQQQRRENAEDICQWTESGRLDAKGLSRNLPGVAEAIRNGSLAPSEVPKMVQRATEEHILAKFKEFIPESALQYGVTRLGALEIMTQAEPLLCDMVRVAVGSDENISHAFAHTFFNGRKLQEKWGNIKRTIHMQGEIVVHVENIALILEVQEAYDESCEYWKPVIESLAKKPMEEHVFMYKKPLDEFLARIGYLIYRDENFGLEDIARGAAFTESLEVNHKIQVAAQAVQNGWDTTRRQCWECGQQNVQVFKCSLCMAARYCSRKCQLKSWKTGHKQACANLKCMYEGFTANYKRIDEALKLQEDKCETPMYEGCPLHPAGSNDYGLLPMMLSKWSFPVVLEMDLVRQGFVSIDNMYKNLAHIVGGRHHWMFEDRFEGGLKEYLDSHVLERANAFEIDYVLQGLLLLTFDTSKLVQICIFISRSSLADQVLDLFKTQLRKSTLDGKLLPVARFIEIYYRLGLDHGTGYENKSSRIKATAKCMELMIKYFHKSAGGPSDMKAFLRDIGDLRGIPITD